MSTRETAFEMDLLHGLDKEILIGQISYKELTCNDTDTKGGDRNRFVVFLKVAG